MKSIVVHLDGSARAELRLRIADTLAQRHGAQLTGLFAATPPLLELPYAYAAEGATVAMMQDLYAGWRGEAEAQWRTTGARGSFAECGAGPVIGAFADQAIYGDLLVLGQHDRDDREHRVPPDFVSSVLLACGRPGLVIPCVGSVASVGTRALVAWKPTAASARALAAALPLLRTAREVIVIEWGRDEQGDAGQAIGIERYLQWHGIRPRMQRSTDQPSEVGELLLSRCADLDADLLVMGCYGHSRAREFVLGGATRTVLGSMTVPVLMSH
jgi:nucleotide-binding universal stress UspA family protein